MKPELAVRRAVRSLGHQFSLNAKNLPGKPDIVLRDRTEVIFVHGCFWHQHPRKGCLDARLPKSNREYWLPKLERNAKRDRSVVRALRRVGWKVVVIWECETVEADKLRAKIKKFLAHGKRKGPPLHLAHAVASRPS